VLKLFMVIRRFSCCSSCSICFVWCGLFMMLDLVIFIVS